MASSSAPRSPSDIKIQLPPLKVIDEQVYWTTVLCLLPSQTECDIDEQLQQELHALGILPPQVIADIEGMTSSLSATTIESDSNKQSSLLSQSTAPTSCSSSEHRPITQSSIETGVSRSLSQSPSLMSTTQAKRTSGFRSGLKNKMAGFKRRKSPTSLDSITTIGIHSPESDNGFVKGGMKSPASIKSSKSSWSGPVSATKARSSYEVAAPVDREALKRSLQCSELLQLQKRQSEVKTRFAEHELALFRELRTRRDSAKDEVARGCREVLEERQQKMDKAVEELEARQLEDELKMQLEHEAEKKTVMTRLRHMEAYCRNPTPPPTPIDATSGRPSLEILPERKVTDRDYHSLAQQYRERDAMDTLHASKINVLRGRQKKAAENLIRKREKEMETLAQKEEKERGNIDQDFASQEDHLRSALEKKRAQLEWRWRTESVIERAKLERTTGLKYVALPDIGGAS